MLGRYALAVVAVLSLMAVPTYAAGSESHRDFDSADLDLTVLQAYMESALAHLESSLRAGASGDFALAKNESDSFSEKVGRARQTLSRIPPEVDSYPYLDRYIWSLDRAGRNLSVIMEGLDAHASYEKWLSKFSASDWTLDSLSENLTGLDRAVAAMRMLKGEVLPACEGLGSDIRALMGSGLTLHDPLSDLYAVTGYAEGLPDDISLDPYLRVLFRPLLDEWAADLSALSLEMDPPQRLGGMLDILSLAMTGLSPGMERPLASGIWAMENASRLDLDVRSYQKDFLSRLSELEGEIDRGGSMQVKLGLLQQAEGILQELDGSLAAERSLLSIMQAYDDRSVELSLAELERLVASYHARLDGLELVFTELSDLSILLSRIVRSNLIGPDTDGDGHISDDEAINMTLPADIDALLLDAEALLDYIGGVISGMDPGTASLYHDAFEALGALSGRTSLLCSSHGSFLENVKAYIEGTRSGEVSLIDALHDLAAMEVAADGLRASMEAIDASGLGADKDSVADLDAQVSLYEDLVLRLLAGSDLDTSMTISIAKGSAPYDTLLDYSVFAVERRMDGMIYLVDDVEVEVLLDDGPQDHLTMRGGRASGSIAISRAMTLGPHVLSSSLVLANGTTLDAMSSFDVRKLRTYIGCSPEMLYLEPMEPGEVGVWLMDELSRPVSGNVSVAGGDLTVEGKGTLTFTYPLTGRYLEALVYAGDAWYQGSHTTIEANVSLEPMLSLSPDLTVVMIGSEFSLAWGMGIGYGELIVTIGGTEFPLHLQANGSAGVLWVNSSVLGIGSFEAYLVLKSLAQWCRDGRSRSSTVLVLSVEDYRDWMERNHTGGGGPDPPTKDDVEVPDQRPLEPLVTPEGTHDPWDFLPDGWAKDMIRRFALPVLVLIFAAFLAISVLVIVRRVRREEKAKAPSLPTAIEVEGSRFYPQVRRRPRKGPRDRLVSVYYEVVDATPGTGAHMTPREVSSHLESKGSKDGRGVMLSFESGIYSREGASAVDPIISGLVRLKEWVSRTLRRGGE